MAVLYAHQLDRTTEVDDRLPYVESLRIVSSIHCLCDLCHGTNPDNSLQREICLVVYAAQFVGQSVR